MDCKYVYNWLLQVEALQPKDWPRDVTRHLKRCAVCAHLARGLNAIEEAWRDQPTPTESKKAKARFLTKLREMNVPQAPAATPSPWKKPLPWIAAAAALMIGANVFVWLAIWPRQQGDKKVDVVQTDVIDRLIDWNLELTNAKPGDRKRLFADSEPVLRKDFKKARLVLSDEEWEDGEELLKTGAKLAENDNPYEHWEMIGELATKLEKRREDAKDDGYAEKYENRFRKIYERGFDPLDAHIKTLKFGPPDFKDWKDSKDFKKGMGPPPFFPPPPQFMQKQMELRNRFEGIMKKGFAKGPPGGGHKK